MPLVWIVTAFCLITTPIAVLFTDKNGNLKGIFKYWQTYDNVVDSRFYVLEKAPKLFRYDFDKYYTESLINIVLDGVSKKKYITTLTKNKLSLKDKFKRYFCRVMWLWRNPAYGFDYFVFGRTINPADIKEKSIKDVGYLRYSRKGNILNKAWCLYLDYKYCNKFYVSLYIGWKLPSPNSKELDRSMIATRINLFKPIRRD